MEHTPASFYEPSYSQVNQPRAVIVTIEPNSPADNAGLEPGMVITSINGELLSDMIVWQWESDGPSIELEGYAITEDGAPFEFECILDREFGQDWGIEFDGAIFDEMRICKNNCVFCFMKMLPHGMRRSLYMRDDDYRLSFLQGNFVTLTNMNNDDVQRVIHYALSPLNVSLHAVSPNIRTKMIGKHAARGIEVLEELLSAGIEIHAQVVLVPGMNDGEELTKTLEYVEAHELISTLGIVPIGFTRHQQIFSESYNDACAAADVIHRVEPYQARSRQIRGYTRFQLADEFYINANIEVPPADYYDGFPQYHDGIGMIRSFLDETELLARDLKPLRLNRRVIVVTGCAAQTTITKFVEQVNLHEYVSVCAVRNEYFGGNVDVTGLLTKCDILKTLPLDLFDVGVVLPSVILNTDGLTLDGVTKDDMLESLKQRGAYSVFCEGSPQALIDAIISVGIDTSVVS